MTSQNIAISIRYDAIRESTLLSFHKARNIILGYKDHILNNIINIDCGAYYRIKAAISYTCKIRNY